MLVFKGVYYLFVNCRFLMLYHRELLFKVRLGVEKHTNDQEGIIKTS